jgi:glycosyltransferase involved in cell wall biosynthesis
MKIYEIATGYTPIPAQIGAATEIVVEALTRAFRNRGIPAEIIDIASANRPATDLPIHPVPIPSFLSGTDLKLGLMHKLKRVIYSCSLARTLKAILNQEKERPVLHFHNQYNLFFFLLLTTPQLRRKALIAYTVHSGIWRQDWEQIKHTVRRRYFQECFCMKHCDLLFVLNQETEETALTQLHVPKNRIVRTCNGIDPLIYRPLGNSRIVAKCMIFVYSVEV